MNKIQVSRNRENHVEEEISNNLAEIGKVERQKEKIIDWIEEIWYNDDDINI